MELLGKYILLCTVLVCATVLTVFDIDAFLLWLFAILMIFFGEWKIKANKGAKDEANR